MPTSETTPEDAPENSVKVLRQPTCATLGPDARLYVGTLTGTVAVLGYDPVTLTARTYCTSVPLRDPTLKDDSGAAVGRTILGIAFHPGAEGASSVGPYVSTSTLNLSLIHI